MTVVHSRGLRATFYIAFPRMSSAELRAERERTIETAQACADLGDRIGATRASRDALLLEKAASAVERTESAEAFVEAVTS